jgi:hypothetical protein
LTVVERENDLTMLVLKDLQNLGLGQLLEELRKSDLKTLENYLKIMEENPSYSGMFEMVLKRVIGEKEKK